VPVDVFVYPPGASTYLDTYNKSQPLLVMAEVTDGLGDPVADDTEVDVDLYTDLTHGCEVVSSEIVPGCIPFVSTVACAPGATGLAFSTTATTRNGIAVGTRQVGPGSTIRELHYEFDGEPSGVIEFPILQCDAIGPSGCISGSCEYSPTGLGDDNDQDWIDGDIVLTGTPGDGEILWEVDLPDSFDARVGIEWGIHVTTGTPSANPSNQMRTGLSYLQTGLTNGAEYHARAQAFLAVSEGIASNPRTISNIASATPSGTPTGLTVHLSVYASRT
jgi:hypothetical protein